MDIFNTPNKRKQLFEPLHAGRIGMYVCGVTVYDMCHIGHARSQVVFDVISRYLRHQGFELTYVRNFTDVDDKIIARANRDGLNYQDIAERYIEEFYTDMNALKIKPADIEPKATEHIKEIIEMVRILEDKGLAYEADGSVYFSVSSFPGYGKLSGRNIDDMIAGARVNPGEEKRNPLDFALWKTSKPGEPSWESPWSAGRPGWHIECSAMSTHYLGATLDIHGGGKDLIFPHHENETAQSEGCFGEPFVRYWVHNGFVTVDNDKMSKSLGNFRTIREILENVHPEVLRMLLLSRHYRSPIDFSPEALDAARSGMIRFYEMLDRIRECGPADSDRIAERARAFRSEFDEAMQDDFNTARAIAALFELTTDVNRTLDDGQSISTADRAALDEALTDVQEILGLLEEDPAAFLDTMRHAGLEDADLTPLQIEQLIQDRKDARQNRDFARADAIRDELKAKGIQLKDSAEGTTWERG